jgi:hypothetical protein
MRSVNCDQATVAVLSFNPGAPCNTLDARLDLAVGYALSSQLRRIGEQGAYWPSLPSFGKQDDS